MTNQETTAKNIILTPASGDFSITVKLDFQPTTNFQSAGLVVYGGDQAFFSVLRRYHSYFGGRCFSSNNVVNGTMQELDTSDPNPTAPVYLKIQKTSTSLCGYYSYDGENWTLIAKNGVSSVTNSGLANEFKIGILTQVGHANNGDCDATFEDFTLNGEIIPFADEN